MSGLQERYARMGVWGYRIFKPNPKPNPKNPKTLQTPLQERYAQHVMQLSPLQPEDLGVPTPEPR